MLLSADQSHQVGLMLLMLEVNAPQAINNCGPSFVFPCMDGTATAELEHSWNYLRDYTKKDARGLGRLNIDSKDRQALRQALLTVASQPWPQASYSPDQESRSILIGVMSSDIRLAVRSLRDYCFALELPFLLPESMITTAPILSSIKGPVYIKYNLQSRKCYVTAYQGRDRGVLLNFGLEQVGHLPLGLWDESMVIAPPPVD